jgi:hypothetical protein
MVRIYLRSEHSRLPIRLGLAAAYHPDHINNYPIKLPPYLRDMEFFLSHFTRNVFE